MAWPGADDGRCDVLMTEEGLAAFQARCVGKGYTSALPERAKHFGMPRRRFASRSLQLASTLVMARFTLNSGVS